MNVAKHISCVLVARQRYRRKRRSPNIISTNIVLVTRSPCFRERTSVCSNDIDAYVEQSGFLNVFGFVCCETTLVNRAENSCKRPKDTFPRFVFCKLRDTSIFSFSFPCLIIPERSKFRSTDSRGHARGKFA